MNAFNTNVVDTEFNPEKKPTAAGIYLFPDVMVALADKHINARAALLLGIVDRESNPNPKYRPEADSGPLTASTSYLATLLAATPDTVRRAIKGLVKLKLLKAREVERGYWELKTPRRESTECGLWISGRLVAVFQAKRITDQELLLLARVNGFKVCYLNNKSFGRLLGVKQRRAGELISGLVECELLNSEWRFQDGKIRRIVTLAEHVVGKPKTTNVSHEDNLPAEEISHLRKAARWLAITLKKCLRHHNMLTALSKPEQWEDEFFEILVSSNENPWRFRNAMTWYVDHIADQWVPQAYSPKAFHEKLVRIERQQRCEEKYDYC